MRKLQAIDIISRAADIYDKQLNQKKYVNYIWKSIKARFY